MQVTEQAGRALTLAAQAARTLGAEQVSGYHLLLGLAEAEGGARHALGASAEQLRAAAATRLSPRPEHQHGVVDVPAAAALTQTLEAGLRAAQAAGRDDVTTVDLLAALLEVREGPAAQVLRSAGGEPAVLRALLPGQDHGVCCRESGVSAIREVLSDMGASAHDLPGRGRAIAGVLANLVPYVLLYAAVLALTWDAVGPELVLAVAATGMLIRAVLGLVAAWQYVRHSVARTSTMLRGLPEELRPVLERLGLRHLEVRRLPGVAKDSCYRMRRRAWIVVSGHSEHDRQRLRFVLWHEIAHLARRDVERRRMSAVLSFGLLTAVSLTFDPRAMLLTYVGVPVAVVGGRWWSEVACDRFAVRRTGAEALQAWAVDWRATVAHLRANKALPRRSRARPLLTHPPLALRTALHRRGHGVVASRRALRRSAVAGVAASTPRSAGRYPSG